MVDGEPRASEVKRSMSAELYVHVSNCGHYSEIIVEAWLVWIIEISARLSHLCYLHRVCTWVCVSVCVWGHVFTFMDKTGPIFPNKYNNCLIFRKLFFTKNWMIFFFLSSEVNLSIITIKKKKEDNSDNLNIVDFKQHFKNNTLREKKNGRREVETTTRLRRFLP